MSWEAEYSRKLRTADDALRYVESGMRVYIQPGCAEPETLVEALIRRAPAVRDVEIVHMMTMGVAPYVAPKMSGRFRHNAVFIGPNVREAINDGRADYTPIYLSEIEELIESGAMPIDVALVEVSPVGHQVSGFQDTIGGGGSARCSWRRGDVSCSVQREQTIEPEGRNRLPKRGKRL